MNNYPENINDINVLKTLISTGTIDINQKYTHYIALYYYNYYGTLLHKASNNNIFPNVKYLVESGSNINEPDTYGNTALHYAAKHNNIDMVKYLVKHGANVDALNIYGCTPLFHAAVYSNISLIEYLLNAGADKDHVDKDNETVMNVAAARHHWDVVEFIESYEGVPTKGVIELLTNDSIE